MKIRKIIIVIGLSLPVWANDMFMGLEPVPIYSEAELIGLEERGEHLERVLNDDCQLVEDIIARANKINLPSYQYLYGDMLLTGTCVDKDLDMGYYYINESASQGLPQGLYKLGEMYSKGEYVQVNDQRAIAYLEESSYLGNLDASILWARMLLDGRGSALDYPKVYKDLKESRASKELYREIKVLMSDLRERMPENKY